MGLSESVSTRNRTGDYLSADLTCSAMGASPDLTSLLADLEGGDDEAVNRVLPLVYEELQVMARRQLRGERDGHTLNTTALVHEAYIRLADQKQSSWQNRAHFFGIAALAMRRILINYARQRRAEKRGGGEIVATFVEGDVGREARTDELLALDEALDRLAQMSERQARIVELWFFGGLTQDEISEVMGISVPTIRRDWRMARAWLSRELKDEGPLA